MRNFFLIVASWLCTACTSLQIHHHMTIDEIRSTFHVESHALVPEYEVVPIHYVEKRSLPDDKENIIDDPIIEKQQESEQHTNPKKKRVTLKVFGKPFTLSLTPTEGLLKKGKLKIWTIEPNATAQHGIEYVEIPDEPVDEIGEIYQDEENQAAVLIRKEKDGIILEGSIGSHFVIRPIPPRLRKSFAGGKKNESPELDPINDDEMFLDQDGDLSSEIAIDTGLPIKRNESVQHHIIFRREKEDEDSRLSDYALMEPDHISKRFKRSTNENISRKKRDAPYTIYPEILVIVDYDGYRLHGGDNLQVKRYFVSFWNGVDLRYKLLKGPKVRISIAGIIISRGRDATPYLERNRVGRDAIDSAAALTDMGKYLFRERRLPVYDIAVAITKLDMCRRSYPNDHCNRGTAACMVMVTNEV